MKRIFTFFFALLSACTFSAYAEIVDGTCGDNLTWTLNTKDSTLVISGTGEMANYSYLSPAPWSGYKIYIKYVILPDGLTSIGEEAFNKCSGLTSITIPNSVTSIGNNAFAGCGLTSVTLGKNLTSIGDGAFHDCHSLTSITIPNSVTEIGADAFSSCYRLTSVTIPNSVKSIGNGAFGGCSGLTSITIPNSVTSIGYGAFSSCSSLKSIIVQNGNPIYDSRENCNAIIETATNTLIAGCQNTIIPNSVTSIGDRAFEGCSSLTSITIPNSVTSIGSSTFSDCYRLTSITLGNSVKSIGKVAFYYCSGLTSITIPNSVTSIGSSTFEGCYRLTSVTLGNSLTSIGDRAFKDCTSLAIVNVEATTPPTLGADALSSSPTCNIPCGTLEVYQASNWQNFVGEFVEQCSDDSGDDGDIDKDLTIIFSDRDNNQISAQNLTLRIPLAPEIEGFTFLYWLPVAEPLDDVITIQAVYGSDSPTAAPEVFVNPSNPAQKLIRNGQVYILHEDKMYTISGQVVK